MRALVTGGAGFIGGHVVDALVAEGHEVVVLDNLEPTVHEGERPSYLNEGATYAWGDIRDRDAVRAALAEAEVVYHLASLIDVAESAREPRRYMEVNVVGTATLLQGVLEAEGTVRRLILASSVAVYGEGAYECPTHGTVEVTPRPDGQLEAERWEVRCPRGDADLTPRATPETRRAAPFSVYGVTKLAQEQLVAAAARSLSVPAVILRFANVYGPRQRPGPYAGVCTTFYTQLQAGEPLLVYEDGRQTRDFIAVRDVVAALRRAAEARIQAPVVANVGTGVPTSVLDLADLLGDLLGVSPSLQAPGEYRPGEIRHLWVDPGQATDALQFQAGVSLRKGLRETFLGP